MTPEQMVTDISQAEDPAGKLLELMKLEAFARLERNQKDILIHGALQFASSKISSLKDLLAIKQSTLDLRQ